MNTNTEEKKTGILTIEDQLTDEKLFELEAQYPMLNRLNKGWKLMGFEPKSHVPVYIYIWADLSKYNGEKLRQLRKERGVGSSKVRKRLLQAAAVEQLETEE